MYNCGDMYTEIKLAIIALHSCRCFATMHGISALPTARYFLHSSELEANNGVSKTLPKKVVAYYASKACPVGVACVNFKLYFAKWLTRCRAFLLATGLKKRYTRVIVITVCCCVSLTDVVFVFCLNARQLDSNS